MALFGQASDDAMLNKVSPLGVGSGGDAVQDGTERDCKRRRLVWSRWWPLRTRTTLTLPPLMAHPAVSGPNFGSNLRRLNCFCFSGSKPWMSILLCSSFGLDRVDIGVNWMVKLLIKRLPTFALVVLIDPFSHCRSVYALILLNLTNVLLLIILANSSFPNLDHKQ